MVRKEIDKMENSLKALTGFVLPGGNITVSSCNISEMVYRKAERVAVSLSERTSVTLSISQYINKLYDCLFVLSREIPHIYKIEEIHWQPNLE